MDLYNRGQQGPSLPHVITSAYFDVHSFHSCHFTSFVMLIIFAVIVLSFGVGY